MKLTVGLNQYRRCMIVIICLVFVYPVVGFPSEKNKQITITGKNTYNSVRTKLKILEKDFDIWEESYPPEKNKNEESKKE